jgi:hypothetical protein
VLRRHDLAKDVVGKLQLALAIELTIIPAYLYACWSIKPPSEGGSDAAAEAARTIRSVMYEEMLHVAAVANILNAIGVQPDVKGCLIKYPGYLPGHVETGPYAFKVGLCGLSVAAIDTFTRIELPEWKAPPPGPGNDWITIAAFYDLIRVQLGDLGEDAFRHGRQIAPRENPGSGYLQPVRDLETARLAIDTIVAQGEGHRPKNPDQPTAAEEDDGSRETAHYYQFATVGSYLVRTPPALAPLIDPARDLYAVIDNPDPATFSDAQKELNLDFNQLWSQLLDCLQATVSGEHPQVFGQATRLMNALQIAAARLRTAGFVPGTSRLAGPTFDYVRVEAPIALPPSARGMRWA